MWMRMCSEAHFFAGPQGDNDDCITWPFVGSVTFTVFNQRDGILRY
jgi:hypothetical protein